MTQLANATKLTVALRRLVEPVDLIEVAELTVAQTVHALALWESI